VRLGLVSLACIPKQSAELAQYPCCACAIARGTAGAAMIWR
jgi:hypothetical protein